MAVPSYTHDLTDWIIDSDTTSWLELTGATGGALPDEADTESALQGTNTVSQATNTIDPFSACRILGASVNLTGKYAFVWHGHGVATALETYALNGLGVAFATDLANWESFTVAGKDTPPFPYGKWVNSAVDPAFATNDRSNGTPPAVTAIFGIGSIGELTAVVQKGQPHVIDIIRTGRGEARINGGETANFATFAGFAALNDAQTARWGLIQETTGGYLWKGLMTLGYTSAVDFRDSNKTIFVQDCRKVDSTFNKIEIRQATSRVDWTGISFACLSPTTNLSKGSLEVIDNADVNILDCSFTDMATFVLLSNTHFHNCTFIRCGQITLGLADLEGCNMIESSVAADTGAVLDSRTTAASTVVSQLDNMTFSKGVNAHHAITFGTGVGHDLTLNGIAFNGFSSVADSNGAALQFLKTTGAIQVSLVGCTVDGAAASASNFAVDDAAGITVTLVFDTIPLKVTVTDAVNGSPIDDARVYLHKSGDTGTVYFSDETDVNGEVNDSIAYPGDTAVVGWVRSFDASGIDYVQKNISGTITSTGLDIAVELERVT